MLKKLLLVLLPFSTQVYGASFEDFTENINIGTEYAQYDYREKVSGKKFMSLKGPLYGINWGYSAYNNDHSFDFNARFLVGKTKYDGQLLDINNTSYNFSNVKNKIFESQILPGIKINVFNLYAGIGYRLKTDMASASSKFYPPRKSQYLYVPLGVKILPHEHDQEDAYLSLIPYFEYDLLVKGRHTSDLTRIEEPKIRLKQKKGYGIKSGITCKISQIEVTPYIYYWNIKASEKYESATLWAVEPANTTTEIGVKISFVF